ncbi:ATP-dependent RNA helicase DDX42-like protein [Cladochytrium replicatum]|nr:ATP-dependent RNA helicase DDX42-like protein [Cladochytrium replicatum]
MPPPNNKFAEFQFGSFRRQNAASSISKSQEQTSASRKRNAFDDDNVDESPTPPVSNTRPTESQESTAKTIFDFEENEEVTLKRRKFDHETAKPVEEDEDDPLEAFMAGIDVTRVTEDKEKKDTTVRRDDLEEEDSLESYINAMKRKGIDVGKSTGVGDAGAAAEYADSDEEMYATAKAIDAANAEDSDEVGGAAMATGKRKEIEPLPLVDHSKMQYPELVKELYEEHEDIAKLSESEVNQVRRELEMTVTGRNPAKPCISFAHFGFDGALLAAVIRHGYEQPTGIQRQAVPVALSGRDKIGIAKTGSGKTAAFVWPMLIHIMEQEELQHGDGPIGLILAPTRELVQQIYTETKKFAKAYDLRVSQVYGGASKAEQFKELRNSGVEIIVATPGRLIDIIKMKSTNLRRVSFLVLDEADRMFDLGFEPQVRSICGNVRPDRQTLLFSATFQKRVERVARDVLEDPVRIVVGTVGAVNTDITQYVQIFDDDSRKWDWLVGRLVGFSVEGSTLVFVSRKGAVDELSKNLVAAGFSVGGLHGDMYQDRLKVLVSTDVAARGLDIKSVKNVVNFDPARDIDSHVHRIGRTGRAGEKGNAFTLLTIKEDRFAAELVRNMEESGTAVPKELMDLAMGNTKFRKQREWSGGGGGGFRGGRGTGRGRGRGRGGRGGMGLSREGENIRQERCSGRLRGRGGGFGNEVDGRWPHDQAGQQGRSGWTKAISAEGSSTSSSVDRQYRQ